LNLRPTTFNRFVPQSFNINSNSTIWRTLNRTVYRDLDEAENRRWLRNEDTRSELRDKNMPASTREVLRKLSEEHGITHLYNEEMFYKVHKITRADFLAKLEEAGSQEARDKIIMALYDDPAC
jgi:hypothetical protein